MSSSSVIKVPPKRHYSENKWIRFQLLEWISFALLVTQMGLYESAILAEGFVCLLVFQSENRLTTLIF